MEIEEEKWLNVILIEPYKDYWKTFDNFFTIILWKAEISDFKFLKSNSISFIQAYEHSKSLWRLTDVKFTIFKISKHEIVDLNE